ncbi:PspA/IM30 family protein [Pradoshia sp. D12]|uniref:PspA/IM30 family protein n=1 Tax=Bacillaceae TaxID=186817 RepID=UPI00112C00AB|nr:MULTISPECIES: PspA/IM30 family protein [Bacillaceae]QFK71521.1 PspA/IM30 family protein [Pradoshia sp. D12]TPF73316.1 PspA/IM30 family protein [Bacillus sp. D12]
MFEFFKRMKTVVSSELYALIEKAEDPIKMADQYLREMNHEIEEAEKTTAKVMAEEKLTHRKITDLKLLIEKRNTQAMEAIQAGKETLAKQALENKLQLGIELASLENLHEQAKQNVKDLQNRLREMKADYQELVMRRDTLKARALSAKVQTSVNRSFHTESRNSAKAGFERMEQKVMEYEAEAEVSKELKSNHLEIDNEFKKMETEKLVESELQRLKDSLNSEK